MIFKCMKTFRRYLIIYDIADEKRLVKIAKLMQNYGVRVQKSIFEAALSKKVLKNLRLDLLQVMDLDDDGVKVFTLCPKCENRVIVIGKGETPIFNQQLLII